MYALINGINNSDVLKPEVSCSCFTVICWDLDSQLLINSFFTILFQLPDDCETGSF